MFALFSIFSLVCVLAVNAQDTCQKYGGVCTDALYCHESLLIKGGLCSNSDQVCCTGANCHKDLGGECVDDCPHTIIGLGMRATDCPTGTNCCVYL